MAQKKGMHDTHPFVVPQPVNILFLDCDGVLNALEDGKWVDDKHWTLEEVILSRLKTLVDGSNAHIVLSTSWRTSTEGKHRLTAALREFGIPAWLSCTRSFGDRTNEILCWLQDNTQLDYGLVFATRERVHHSGAVRDDYGNLVRLPFRLNVAQFVALDDMDFSLMANEAYVTGGHFVRTDAALGLTDKDVRTALKLFQQRPSTQKRVSTPYPPLSDAGVSCEQCGYWEAEGEDQEVERLFCSKHCQQEYRGSVL